MLLYGSLTGCWTSCLIPVPCWTNTDLVIRTHMPLSVFNMDAHCQSWSFMPHLSCHPTVFINNVTATLLCWLATAHASLESCNSVYHPYFPVLLFSHVARQFWDLIQRLDLFSSWLPHVEHFRAFSAGGLTSSFMGLTFSTTCSFSGRTFNIPQQAQVTEVGNCARATLSSAINV